MSTAVVCDVCGAVVPPSGAYVMDIYTFTQGNRVLHADICPECREEVERLIEAKREAAKAKEASK